MSDTTVQITFGGTTTEFEAAAARATAAMRALTDGVNTVTANLAASTQGLNAATPAMAATAKATDTATAAVRQLAPAAKTATADVQALASATSETGAASQKAGMEIKAGVTRELVVLGHEALSGNFTRLPGSFMVLAERIHLTGAAMAGLVIGLATAAVAAAHLVTTLNEVADAKMAAQAAATGGLVTDQESNAAIARAKKIEGVTTETAEKMVSTYNRARGMTKEVLDQLLGDTVNYATRAGTSIEGASRTIAAAFGLQTHAAEEVFKNTRASAETIAAFDKAVEAGQPVQARTVLLRELARSHAAVGGQAAFATKKISDMVAIASQGMGAAITPINDLFTIEAAQNAERLDTALKNISADRDNGSDAGWMRRQETALAQQNLAIIRAATSSKDATDARLANDAAYWQKVLAGENLSVEQRRQAQQKLTQVETQQAEARLRANDAAGKRDVQAEIAALSAEQAAHHDNYAKWMELEAQKLAILKGIYGEKSREYLSELKAEETYEREHQKRLEELNLQRVEQVNALGQRELSERIARLGEEAAAHLRTHAEELAAAREQTEAEQKLELWRLDTLITTLEEGTDEYAKALLKRQELYQTFQTRLAGIDRSIAAENERAAQRSLAVYAQAFERIGSAGESIVTGLAQGTLTWQRAQQMAASAVLSSMVSVGAQLVARWVAIELAKTGGTVAGNMARTQIDAGASPASVLAGVLARWLGLEAAKDGAAVVGAGTRAGADEAADTAAAIAKAASAKAQVMANAGIAGSAAYASIAAIPIVGPGLAPEAASIAYAGAAAYGLPSFAVGAWSLPGDMIAQVHRGEMIVPSFQAEAMRNGASIGGSGGDLHVHISAIDTQSGAAFLAAQMPFLAKRWKQHVQLNPSDRP